MIADIPTHSAQERRRSSRAAAARSTTSQLSADGDLELDDEDSTGASCAHAGQSGAMVIDVDRTAASRLVSVIPTAVGSHGRTRSTTAPSTSATTRRVLQLEIFDSGAGGQAPRAESAGRTDPDSYVDHGDVRSRDAALDRLADVIDVTDARAADLQRSPTRRRRLSQAELNARPDTLVATDEFMRRRAAAPDAASARARGRGPREHRRRPTSARCTYKPPATGRSRRRLARRSGKTRRRYNDPTTQLARGRLHVARRSRRHERQRYASTRPSATAGGIRVVDFADPAAPRSLAAYIPTWRDTLRRRQAAPGRDPLVHGAHRRHRARAWPSSSVTGAGRWARRRPAPHERPARADPGRHASRAAAAPTTAPKRPARATGEFVPREARRPRRARRGRR